MRTQWQTVPFKKSVSTPLGVQNETPAADGFVACYELKYDGYHKK